MEIYSNESLQLRRRNETGRVDDGNFGPFYKVPGKATFDFTLLFEETILSIVPSVLLLFLVPPRIQHLWKSPRKVIRSHILTTKVILLSIFSILQIVNVITISHSPLKTRASLPAALLALIATLGLCILSYFEHSRNVRPSSIINAYLFFTLPFDAAQLRTRWLRGDNVAGNAISTSILGVKLLLLILEAKGKRKILFQRYGYLSTESTSGLFARSLFWWLNPLFRLGFGGVVRDEDLFVADGELLSDACEDRLRKYWEKRTKYPQNHTLMWVMLRAMLGPLTASILPRLALTFFRFMQPFLINKIVSLVSNTNSESSNNGWGLIAASGLIYIGLALTTSASQHKVNRMTTMVRGALISAIYSHTLELSLPNLDQSAAVTLMSSDVERICVALQPIHNLWASPLEIVLAIWLLQREIGIALLGPLFVTITAVSGPFFMAKYMGAAQKLWMDRIQMRIDTSVKMLQSIKGVKMLGLSERTSSVISQLRENEIRNSLKMRRLFVVMIAFGNVSDIFAPGAAFIIYAIVASVNGKVLDVSSAFTALSLIALLVAPIRAIVFAVPPLIASVGCLDRIESFLTSATKRDHRLVSQRVQGLSSGHTSLGISSRDVSASSEIELEITMVRADKSESPATIAVKNLFLAWSTESPPVVTDVSFSIPPATLTMIIGPIGSGKSSLLKGLLGEIPSTKGNVYINHSQVALVDQTSWIQNCSIRDNIIGTSDYESAWYQRVIHVCALENDIEGMIEGDNTIAGSGGAALSGGQKLRIALARAVYSRHKILMLDDVFSGLDIVSEEQIFTRLLGRHGLLRQLGITTILVTHAAHRLSYADDIIALSVRGTVAEQGTFYDLTRKNGYVSSLATKRVIEEDTSKESESVDMKDDDTARQIACADLERPIGSWATYQYYFESLGWWNMGMWTGMIVCYSLLLQFPSSELWIKFWTSAIAIHGSSINGFYLGILIAVEVASMLLLMILTSILLLKMIPQSATILHTALLTTISNAPLYFLTKTDTGSIINRLSHDLSVLDSELPIAFLIVINNIFTSLIQALLICISASYFSLALPFILILIYLLQKYYLRTSRQIRLMDLSSKAPLHTHFLETLTGLLTIRAFGFHTVMQQRHAKLLDNSQKPFYLLYCIQVWLMLVIDLLVAALAILLVALVVKLRYTTDAGLVGVALVNIMGFNTTLSAVIIHWTATETSVGAVERIRSFVRGTPDENRKEDEDTEEGETEVEVPEDWPNRGAIRIQNVTASYSKDQEPCLRNINLDIPAGQKISICGASGAGKSSFIVLLLHMLEVQQGSIMIDGIDILKIPRQILRERMVVIPQDPVFVNGSIRQNLDPFSLQQDDVEIIAVLEKLGLFLPGVIEIEGLSDDFDPYLLSHGQRQLFCLARAVLGYRWIARVKKRCPIVVMDEVSASVDVETEEVMKRIVGEEFGRATVLGVAHREGMVRACERMVVFAKGRVLEGSRRN
ncbi:putative abc multidrug protein [Botrytis fragariae]|uniref:Putative abc multidrug protein n=1 Tax=Botrytis fragariae TaxID=1964551 RepID=A0A8H6B4Q3_9HELO|nr:putative abc multidrug protein [Botrytis fragariae]KAF5879184.1 putative abc multidrug protein [Botrytis fragariae]